MSRKDLNDAVLKMATQRTPICEIIEYINSYYGDDVRYIDVIASFVQGMGLTVAQASDVSLARCWGGSTYDNDEIDERIYRYFNP